MQSILTLSHVGSADVPLSKALAQAGVRLSPRATSLLGHYLGLRIESSIEPECTQALELQSESELESLVQACLIWSEVLRTETTWRRMSFGLLAEFLTVWLPPLQDFFLKKNTIENSLHDIRLRAEPLPLFAVLDSVLRRNFSEGIVFYFLTAPLRIGEESFVLFLINGEGYGKRLCTMPISKLEICHLRNYWIHGEGIAA